MKFTDGNWLTRKGVRLHFASEVNDYRIAHQVVTLYVPCKSIHHRGNTLDGPLLTLRISSPHPGVIRVQAGHFLGEGERGPHFQVWDQACPLAVEEDAETLTVTSGSLSAVITKGHQWELAFYRGGRSGKRLTASGNRALAYVQTDSEGTFMREQLNLGVGENVYGLGERFTSFIKNGQSIDVWNEDGGTGTEQAYKNIPFYLTNRGYGVFVNHPERVSYEVASERVSRVQFSVVGESLDYFVIDGPSPKDVLEKYTTLTGKPALPPAWSFGLWLTTSFTTDYDEATVNHFVDGMAERDIPLHVFHFDCFWMKEFEWCNFEWDNRVFPDPEGMLKRLKDKGLRICVWINPYIAQKSPLFAEGAKNGYLLKRPNGDVWQWDLWQAGMGVVDFTNPDACAWYNGYLRRLLDMGVDCFKTDFGERIPTDVVYFDGSDPEKMHNYYAFLYNQVVFDLLKAVRGEGEAVLFARSATAGGQQFPVHWGGDNSANYESMAESLRGGLSLGLSGFGFWSHDIGGFESTSSADVYKRWAAFGLLSSHSRLHGSSSYRVPWLYDDEAVDVVRHFSKLKCTLMPYLFGQAVQAASEGLPVMRAMFLEFQTDVTTHYLDRQYMLGDSILVAPVFHENGEVTYYLPDGRWTHLQSNELVQGGQWETRSYDYLSLPLFAREGAIVPMGIRSDVPDYDYCENVAFHVFEPVEGQESTTTVYDSKGNEAMTLRVMKSGGVITVSTATSTKPWSVVLRNIGRVTDIDSGTICSSPLGVQIQFQPGTSRCTIRL